MKICAAVLTCFDRPALLRQSLDDAIAQCQQARLPLWIFDDGSTDHDTLEMLARAKHADGVEVFTREPDGLHAHLSTGRRFVEAVSELRKRFGTSRAFLKLDDDIVLAPDAIERLVEAWRSLWAVGAGPAALSGLATPHTRLYHADQPPPDNRTVAVRTETACSVAVVHRLDLWARCIQALGIHEIVKTGWDTAFFHRWLKHAPELNACFTLCPSVVWHAGHTGTHLIQTDHNRRPPDPFAFPGEWDGDRPKGAVADEGDMSGWMRTYGERTCVPADC